MHLVRKFLSSADAYPQDTVSNHAFAEVEEPMQMTALSLAVAVAAIAGTSTFPNAHYYRPAVEETLLHPVYLNLEVD